MASRNRSGGVDFRTTLVVQAPRLYRKDEHDLARADAARQAREDAARFLLDGAPGTDAPARRREVARPD